MRKHGLQLPLDPHQVASWIIFFALASGVYAFYVPFVEDAGTRWFLVALYSVLVVCIVALDLYTSWLDPSDPGLFGATDGEFFCGLCQASVGRNSKHCRACDRCVQGFDHHCKWLNNCVGACNYKHFFLLVGSTVSLLILQFAWGLWLFVRSFTEADYMRLQVADKYGTSVVYGGWQAALAIYMALLTAAILMLGELFSFHIILISKGMSTYDYIIAQRDEKLAKEASGSEGSGGSLAVCRSGKVADATTAKRKVRVGINPCAAIKTSKPPRPATWDSKLANKPGSMNQGSEGIAAGGLGLDPGSGKLEGKEVKEAEALAAAVASGSGKGGGMGEGEAGGVEAMVSRAVAEQGRVSRSGERDSTLLQKQAEAGFDPLRAAPGLATSPSHVHAQGCKDCSGEAEARARARNAESAARGEFSTITAAGSSGSPDGAKGSPGYGAAGAGGPGIGGVGAGAGAGIGRVRSAGRTSPSTLMFDSAGPSRRPVSASSAAAAAAKAAAAAAAGTSSSPAGGGGRHLGGSAAGTPSGPHVVGAQPRLPPLLPTSPSGARNSANRSLLYPNKSPSRDGMMGRDLPATPE